MKAMVLAAGAGTRLDPLTMQLPKPLAPVANKPVMEHVLRLLSEHDLKQVCANLHYLPHMIREYFQNLPGLDVEINYLLEHSLSGDAGGVRACKHMLSSDTFLVIMGDLVTNADLSHIIAQHKKMNALATIALKPVTDVSHFGVAVIDKDGWIKEFQEKPQPHEARSNLVSTGIYILEPAVFDFIPPTGKYGFGKQLFPDLVSKNLPILGIKIDAYWSDVGTIQQYCQSNFDALSNKVKLTIPGQYNHYPNFSVWSGENVCIEQNSLIEGKLLLGKNSIVSEGAKITGHVIIGDNCLIEADAQIKDSIIWAGSHIGQKAKIIDSVLGLNSHIETGKQINNTAFVMPEEHGKKSICEVLV